MDEEFKKLLEYSEKCYIDGNYNTSIKCLCKLIKIVRKSKTDKRREKRKQRNDIIKKQRIEKYVKDKEYEKELETIIKERREKENQLKKYKGE